MSAPIDEVRRLRIAVLNRSFVSTGGGGGAVLHRAGGAASS